MDPSEKRIIAVSMEDKLPIDLNLSGQELNKEIVNQYGQLLGEYSKLDDELWLAPPDDDDALRFCSEGLEWKIMPSNPQEHTADLQSLEQADNSLTEGGVTSMENNSSSFNDLSQNHSCSFSPVSILKRGSLFNETTFVTKRARSKHRHSAKECSHYRSTKCSRPKGLVKTRKITDLLQLQSVEKNPPTELVKKCVHCDSVTTPQWRNGPTGRKTLCNACGLQYKKGLLSPYYRPLRTTKPQKPQTQVIKKCVHCESANTPQWRDGPLGRKTLCNACGIQYKKRLLSPEYRPIRNPIFDASPDPANISLCDPYHKKAEEMIMSDNSEIDSNYAGKSKTVEYIIGETSNTNDSNSSSDTDTDFKPTVRRKPPVVEDKTCAHCESSNTPQWRTGPLGRKTLCNACGVQYRNGRLFPEYRPLQSPTYDPSVHSHLPKRVEQMRMMKLCAEHTTFGNNEQQPHSHLSDC